LLKPSPKVIAYLGVGSNLGDRLVQIESACDQLKQIEGIQFKRMAEVYETEPVGQQLSKSFLNTVFEIETTLKARELLVVLEKIEAKMGRKNKGEGLDREIDLDLLFYSDLSIYEQGLRVPHPRLHERYFVLKPFCDLTPDWVHPELGFPMSQLLSDLYKTV